MILKYRILWLDDKIQDYVNDEVIVEIEDHLKENGFNPEIITVDNSKDFFDKLDDKYDLILTDYNMNGKNGDVIVDEIRRNHSILTEILFYTAQANLSNTDKISRISFLETNTSTSAHIERVISKAIELIDLTIKKFQQIVPMRGMIMHATSILDLEMLDVIKKALKDEKIKFDTGEIYDELLSMFSTKIKTIQNCKEKDNFNKLTKDNFVFSAAYKIKTLSQIIKNKGLDDFSEEYNDDVNKTRNIFAHSVLKVDESGHEYFNNIETGTNFNEENCIMIRKKILKHRDNLINLKKAMDN